MTKPTEKLLKYWEELPEESQIEAQTSYFNGSEALRQLMNKIPEMSDKALEKFIAILESGQV
jgi:hypothetical protein